MSARPEVTGRASSESALDELIGCTVRDACRRTGLKPTKLYELINTGAIESTKVGKRRIIVVRSLRRLIEGTTGERAA